jgi:hypothetical protein
MAFPPRRLEVSPWALHSLALSLARQPDVAGFARALARVPAVRDRLGRIAAVFTFVNTLVNVPASADGRMRDGVDVLLRLAGEENGPAVILCALLQALGERASIVCGPGRSFVRVEVEARDFPRLPPHAGLFSCRGRYYIPLDAREARSPLGFLPRLARGAALGDRGI